MPKLGAVRYSVPTTRDDWTLPEETMPESQPHDILLDLLKQLLLAWVKRSGLDAQVARNLAVRWDEAHPQIGIDPDLVVISPRTPEGDELTSLCTWNTGHYPPMLAVEVVSESNPRKDYVTAPDRYSASGIGELWIFDPKLAGPKSHGGPHRIQLWRRDDDGGFSRLYAGEGPVRSPAVGGYLVAVDEGRKLRIATDEALSDFWMTAEEGEREAKEREREAKEAAQARIAELEELLRLKG